MPKNAGVWFKWLLAGLLIVTGMLKALDWQSVEAGRISNFLRLIIVDGEWTLAAWLLWNRLPRLAWVASLASFLLFLVISTTKFLHGNSSCGCFGAIPVSPIFTIVLDVLVICALLVFRYPGELATELAEIRRPAIFLPVALSLVIGPLLVLSVILVSAHHLEGRLQGLLQSGNAFLLQPDQWVGKPFPLNAYLEDSDAISHGRWLVLLVHTDCPDCQDAMNRYRAAAEARGSAPGEAMSGRSIAFLVVPSSTQDTAALVSSPGIKLLQLVSKHEWFATTPAAIQLNDNIVTRVLRPPQTANVSVCLAD